MVKREVRRKTSRRDQMSDYRRAKVMTPLTSRTQMDEELSPRLNSGTLSHKDIYTHSLSSTHNDMSEEKRECMSLNWSGAAEEEEDDVSTEEDVEGGRGGK